MNYAENKFLFEKIFCLEGYLFLDMSTISNSRTSSDYNATSYLSSSITASNGSLNINTKEDTDIIGSSLLAKDVNLVTSNLNVESLQSQTTSHSENNSYSFGGTIGFNNGSSDQDRLWTDNLATIIGTNSVTINTENNTNIIGAVIANSTNGIIGSSSIDGGNLTINTKTLTYSNLDDHNNSSSSQFGLSVTIPLGLGTPQDEQGNPQWGQGVAGVFSPKYSSIGLNYADNSQATTARVLIMLGSNLFR